MRLLGLKVRNIASLKGEHTIWFRDIAAQSPLFAITGETGSGKSTLLNSIGLALYGEVYKKNVDQLDVVTLGEKEGQIELIFQVKGKNYLALWRAKVRKQDGTPYAVRQSPQREIYLLAGESFESPRTIELKKAHDILNLDFDQFCKCIILNQGEFARFLTSSFTERKEILEKLYPGEMLDSLSSALKEELNVLQNGQNEIEIELKTLQGDGAVGENLAADKEKLKAEGARSEEILRTLERWDSHFVSVSGYFDKYNDNKRKSGVLKDDLTVKTRAHNNVLSEVTSLEQDLSRKRKDQEVRLPRLNELSKLEENFKTLATQFSESTKKLKEIKKRAEDTEGRLKALMGQREEWAQREQVLVEGFHFPLASLIQERNHLTALTDLFEKNEAAQAELRIKETQLQEREDEGKKKSLEHKSILEVISASPKNISSELEVLEKQRSELQKNWEKKRVAEAMVQEIAGQLQKLTHEKELLTQKNSLLQAELTKTREELLPVETTLQLQGLLTAVEVCLTHPSVKDECPVCQRTVSANEWASLRQKMAATDLSSLKLKETTLNRHLLKTEEELLQASQRLKSLTLEFEQKSTIHAEQIITATLNLPMLASLEEKIATLTKSKWELAEHEKLEEKLRQELQRTRETYALLKKDCHSRAEAIALGVQKLNELHASLKFLPPLTRDHVSQLKEDGRKLLAYLEHRSLGEKLNQEQSHLQQLLDNSQVEIKEFEGSLVNLEKERTILGAVLEKELAGKEAQEIITQLNKLVRDAENLLSAREKDLKLQSDAMKFIQGQITSLEELLRDLDMQFAKELHALRESAMVQIDESEELIKLTHTLQKLDLHLTSPRELFLPISELIEGERSHWKTRTDELKMELAKVLERISSWEKKLDRIQLLKLKLTDIVSLADRKLRLYEVLGKDELRTFVLSLVEENLIVQTNEELTKLCQGRYEIIHQSGRMRLPEFYVLDKFREGELRKISTLSGGETFMVSLAMALGLAEMTRGTAEIDSLFIDEGFGTLDQDSLEDVVDMLKQIQTRGLMVGVISHIKALTNSMPVNLVVSKKQDGTSSLTVIHN